MRKAHFFFVFISACMVIIAILLADSRRRVSDFSSLRNDLGELTASLSLTDMSFSNDARYTRHPSQADLFSAFQDYPGSIEHFPSGSVTPPPDFSSFNAGITVRRR